MAPTGISAPSISPSPCPIIDDSLIDPTLREPLQSLTGGSIFQKALNMSDSNRLENSLEEERRRYQGSRRHSLSSSMPCSIPQEPQNTNVKSASSWTDNDLKKLNVKISEISIEEFFGCTPEALPTPTFIYEELNNLVTEDYGILLNKKAVDPQIARYIQLAWATQNNEREALTDILALDTLRILGFEALGKYESYNHIGPQHRLYFEADSRQTCAIADLVLLFPERRLLGLFVENKRFECKGFPHAQIFAQALAAYNVNNTESRQQTQNFTSQKEVLEELDYGFVDMVMPAFSMMGSIPCFYLIPITAAFASAVAKGQTPHDLTVYACAAPYNDNDNLGNLGQIQLPYRKLCLSLFEAFKAFVPTNFFELCPFNQTFKAHLEMDPLLSPVNKRDGVWSLIEKDFHTYFELRKDDHLVSTPNYFLKRSAWFRGLPFKQRFSPKHTGHPIIGNMHPPPEGPLTQEQTAPVHHGHRRRSLSSSIPRSIPPSPNINTQSASYWTADDLTRLNVKVMEVSIEEFFGCTSEDLPIPTFIHERLNTLITGEYKDIPDKRVDIQVARYIQLVWAIENNAHEALTDSLATETLRILGFEALGKYDIYNRISPQHRLYFEADSRKTCAVADLILLCPGGNSLSLFVENKRLERKGFPHAQIFAQALAAYNVNNIESRHKTKESRLSSEVRHVVNYGFVDMVIPAFSMIGTIPCFYLVPITAAFASAVARGETPPDLVVYACHAPYNDNLDNIDNIDNIDSIGQISHSYRKLCLSMFEAFKTFVPTNFFELCPFDPVLMENSKRDIPQSPVWQCIQTGVQKYPKLHHLSPIKNYFVDEPGLVKEGSINIVTDSHVPRPSPAHLHLPKGPPHYVSPIE